LISAPKASYSTGSDDEASAFMFGKDCTGSNRGKMVMRSAALHGKVPITEDILTASFVDLVRVHDAHDLLRDLIEIASCADADGKLGNSLAEVVPPRSWNRFELQAWPRWSTGEPDLTVDLFCGDALTGRLVVEVKAGASKSGDDEGAPEMSDLVNPDQGDQLARYLWEAATEVAANVPVALIYLTHHAAAPRKELADSLAGLRRRTVKAPIAWASWRDIEDRLLPRSAQATGAFCRDLNDAIAVLRRAGLFRFRGQWRRSASVVQIPQILFWKPLGVPSVAKTHRGWRLTEKSVSRFPGHVFWLRTARRGRRLHAGGKSLRAVPAQVFYLPIVRGN
jgi:hypothetical protein